MSNPHISVFTATKILLPIDFSPSSEAALEAATGLAQQFHASVHLVHITPEFAEFNGSSFFPDTAVLQARKETMEQRLDTCRERLVQKHIPASFSIELDNDIVGSLMRVIKREHIDLVVISTHGMSGWHPLVFGSLAEHVIKHVTCTLLLLQSGHGCAPEEPAIHIPESSFIPQGAGAGHQESTTPITATPAQRQLDRIADDLAEQGARTEQRYDQSHSLFTK